MYCWTYAIPINFADISIFLISISLITQMHILYITKAFHDLQVERKRNISDEWSHQNDISFSKSLGIETATYTIQNTQFNFYQYPFLNILSIFMYLPLEVMFYLTLLIQPPLKYRIEILDQFVLQQSKKWVLLKNESEKSFGENEIAIQLFTFDPITRGKVDRLMASLTLIKHQIPLTFAGNPHKTVQHH